MTVVRIQSCQLLAVAFLEFVKIKHLKAKAKFLLSLLYTLEVTGPFSCWRASKRHSITAYIPPVHLSSVQFSSGYTSKALASFFMLMFQTKMVAVASFLYYANNVFFSIKLVCKVVLNHTFYEKYKKICLIADKQKAQYRFSWLRFSYIKKTSSFSFLFFLFGSLRVQKLFAASSADYSSFFPIP